MAEIDENAYIRPFEVESGRKVVGSKERFLKLDYKRHRTKTLVSSFDERLNSPPQPIMP